MDDDTAACIASVEVSGKTRKVRCRRSMVSLSVSSNGKLGFDGVARQATGRPAYHELGLVVEVRDPFENR